MKSNHNLFANMRAAARSMMRRGPAMTADAVQQALHNASVLHQAARKMVDPATSPVTTPTMAPADVLGTLDLPRGTRSHAPGAFSDGVFTNDAGTRTYKLY